MSNDPDELKYIPLIFAIISFILLIILIFFDKDNLMGIGVLAFILIVTLILSVFYNKLEIIELFWKELGARFYLKNQKGAQAAERVKNVVPTTATQRVNDDLPTVDLTGELSDELGKIYKEVKKYAK